MIGVYHIVDLNVRIESRYPDVHKVCEKFATTEPYDVSLRISPEDSMFQKKFRPGVVVDGKIWGLDTEGYKESRAFCRAFAGLMPERNAFLFHGSAIAVDGEAYVFAAKSGTGKSTHTALWRKLLGDRAVMINDDKPILKVTDQETRAYGTPWCGKHRLGNNVDAPVKAICILERGEENSIEEISRAEAMPILMQQAHRPVDPGATLKTLQLVRAMNVRFFRLKCNMDISAAELAYNTMRG